MGDFWEKPEYNSITDTVLADLGNYGHDKNKIRINVYSVCENAGQFVYFRTAINALKSNHRDIFNKLEITELTNNEIRKQQLTPQEVSDWLLESDIHIILSHIHQGLLSQNYFEWTPRLIDQFFFRLNKHRGFPNGIFLKCPIFLQDKYVYLSAIESLCLPTLKVPIPIDLNSFDIKAIISE